MHIESMNELIDAHTRLTENYKTLMTVNPSSIESSYTYKETRDAAETVAKVITRECQQLLVGNEEGKTDEQ